MANTSESIVRLTTKKYVAEAKMRQHYAVIDEPLEIKGGDSAPTPVEYLLTALGGCVSITLRMYAERKGWDLGEINVRVTQEEVETTEGKQKALVEEISFEKSITEEQKEKLLQIAAKCPVAKIIKGETVIQSKINR
jgi:putative redox protein